MVADRTLRQHPQPPNLRLLRTRGERPGNRCAGKRDELAPFHAEYSGSTSILSGIKSQYNGCARSASLSHNRMELYKPVKAITAN
jgi:hypothetical protein